MKWPLSESGELTVPRYGGDHEPAKVMRPLSSTPVTLPRSVTGPVPERDSPPHPTDELCATEHVPEPVTESPAWTRFRSTLSPWFAPCHRPVSERASETLDGASVFATGGDEQAATTAKRHIDSERDVGKLLRSAICWTMFGPSLNCSHSFTGPAKTNADRSEIHVTPAAGKVMPAGTPKNAVTKDSS